MTIKRDARGTLRDYKREYQKFGASEKAKKDRAARNSARRSALKAGRVHKGDGKEIDHKNSNPRDNSPSNLRVVSRHTNRAKKENSRRRGSRRNRSSWGL
jgi:hypothetical protein